MHNVAVLHHIILTFDAQLTSSLGASLTAKLDVVIVGNRLGTDEAALKVGVNDASCLGGGVADVDGPGLDLHLARREVGLQAQQVVGSLGQTAETRLFQAKVSQVHGRVFLIKLSELALDLGAQRQRLDAADFGKVGRDLVLVDVCKHHDGLHGHEVQVVEVGAFLIVHLHGASRVALVHPGSDALHGLVLGRELLVALRILLKARQGLLHRGKVGQNKLSADDVKVALGVGAAVGTHNVGILKVAHDLADGVALTNVRKELVAQALALAGTFYQTGDVNELDGCGHDAAGMHDVGKLLESLVRHGHDALVGLDSRKGIVRRQDVLLGERVEERRLAHVGQADDADGEGHVTPCSRKRASIRADAKSIRRKL